jgi:hypothetical protein
MPKRSNESENWLLVSDRFSQQKNVPWVTLAATDMEARTFKMSRVLSST